MFRPADVDTPDDFYQYYRNHWLGVPVEHFPEIKAPPGVRYFPFTPGAPHTVEKSPGFVGHIVTNVEGLTTQVLIKFKTLVDAAQFGQPYSGYIDAGPTVAWVPRNAPRNAGRGFRLPNGWTRMGVLHLTELGQTDVVPNVRTVLIQLFNKTFTDWKLAINALLSGDRLATAIHDDWALSLMPHTPEIQVLYRQETVGYIAPDPGPALTLGGDWAALAKVLVSDIPGIVVRVD